MQKTATSHKISIFCMGHVSPVSWWSLVGPMGLVSSMGLSRANLVRLMSPVSLTILRSLPAIHWDYVALLRVCLQS